MVRDTGVQGWQEKEALCAKAGLESRQQAESVFLQSELRGMGRDGTWHHGLQPPAPGNVHLDGH